MNVSCAAACSSPLSRLWAATHLTLHSFVSIFASGQCPINSKRTRHNALCFQLANFKGRKGNLTVTLSVLELHSFMHYSGLTYSLTLTEAPLLLQGVFNFCDFNLSKQNSNYTQFVQGFQIRQNFYNLFAGCRVQVWAKIWAPASKRLFQKTIDCFDC